MAPTMWPIISHSEICCLANLARQEKFLNNLNPSIKSKIGVFPLSHFRVEGGIPLPPRVAARGFDGAKPSGSGKICFMQ
jgi:hypothetical protein